MSVNKIPPRPPTTPTRPNTPDTFSIDEQNEAAANQFDSIKNHIFTLMQAGHLEMADINTKQDAQAQAQAKELVKTDAFAAPLIKFLGDQIPQNFK